MTASEFRQWRTAAGLSQREAASLLGIGERTLRKLESGERPVSEAVEAKVRRLLGRAGVAPVNPTGPAGVLGVVRVGTMRAWAMRLPRELDPIVAAVLGVPARAWATIRHVAPVETEVPPRLAVAVRALTEPMAYVGATLTTWRASRKLTVEAAADLLDVPPDRLRLMESHPTAPLPVDVAVRLAVIEAS